MEHGLKRRILRSIKRGGGGSLSSKRLISGGRGYKKSGKEEDIEEAPS